MSEPRCYTAKQVIAKLSISRASFHEHRAEMPFLEELKPRIGRTARYRADLVDRYLAGQWQGPRAFRRSA
jgi:hypothetical protein